MKFQGIYDSLSVIFKPLSLKVLLLLYDRPHTKMELYTECNSWNNTVVKDVLEVLTGLGLVVGGSGRGAAYRLTLKGRSVSEWLTEGGMVL